MQFTTSDGLSLFYLDEGEGTPVLCLPGLTRHTGDFDDLACWLTEVRLIRMSYRGRKGSDFDPDFMNYNVRREMQDAIELLDHLKIAKVTVVGTSRGGLIAMMMGMLAPERLNGVILNDVGPELALEGLAKILGYLGVTPALKTAEEGIIAVKSLLGKDFPYLLDEKWRQCVGLWFDLDEKGLKLNYDPRLRDAMLEQAKSPPPDMWKWFNSLKEIPLGLIRGANSDLITPETVARMQEHHPGMIVGVVPNRGHVPFLDEPESREVITEVLRQVASEQS